MKALPTQTFIENDARELFVEGRALGLRRSAPSANDDVLAGDKLGDYVNDGTYEYKLVETASGTLKWDRRALDVAW